MLKSLIAGVVLLLPMAAGAQEIDGLSGDGPDWATLLPALVGGLIAMASALSAVFPSVGKVMKIIDVIALNVGKARNSEDAQK